MYGPSQWETTLQCNVVSHWRDAFHKVIPVLCGYIYTMFLQNNSAHKELKFNITWWRHQIEAFPTLLALCEGIHQLPVASPHKDQWWGALMFSFICTWKNGWAIGSQWFEMPSRSLWLHCDELSTYHYTMQLLQSSLTSYKNSTLERLADLQ